MKIGVISGSHRNPSQSAKVARYLASQLTTQGICKQPWVFELADNPLPLWEEKIWDADPEWQARLGPLSTQLADCDGFIFVAPEWHGMVPAGLKNFFLMWGKGELAHKPALIVTVSSADGGSYPIAELRMSSYKNNRICFIPEHLIIRYVETVLNDDPADNNDSADGYFRQRIAYALGVLEAYAEGFKTIRHSKAVNLETYGSGM